MKPGFRVAVVAVALAGLAAAWALMEWSDGVALNVDSTAAPAGAISLAVLGDSNSHSYQDRVGFPASSPERGGELRPSTFQWTEVLGRLRTRELNQGPWGVWGRHAKVARVREWLGLEGGRWPRKEDYRYNFAYSGAACADLLTGRQRQARRLVELMDQEPERWRQGVVVVRMGLNDWMRLLDLQARDPAAPEVRAAAAYCAGEIGRTVALIHASHPSTRILLVGLGNEADDPSYADRWQSAAESANINAALDGFNAAVRRLAADAPKVAYFDDLEWFKANWGARDDSGKPDYKTVAIGPSLRVTNTLGNEANHALLADAHAGTVWNALWAQALVVRLNEAFDLKLTPISDAEVVRFLEPLTGSPKVPGS